MDIETLRALNPGHVRGTLSPYRPKELLLPVGTRDGFEANIAELSPEELVQWQTYRIKPGDNLGRIARKFETDIAMLQQLNGIQGNKIRAGDTLNVPLQEASHLIVASNAATATGYRVRTGDSLYRIADKFKVSIRSIVAWNALDPEEYLQPGQQLTLYISDG